MGQRQRLRIAMTFLPDPEIVLLDEPLTSLDDEGAAVLLRRDPAAARSRRGRAVVLAQRRTPGAELRRALAHRPGKAGAGMSEAITAGHAFLAVMRRDLHVFLSYRTRLVSQVLTSLFSLTLFYYVSRLVHVSGFHSPSAYFGFVVVGISMVGVLYSCFSIPELLRQELVAGTFDRLLLSPFGAVRSVIAMTLFPLMCSFVLAATHARARVRRCSGCSCTGRRCRWASRRCCSRCSRSCPSACCSPR